ncbi:MAG TPA: hypothetical protein VII83_02575, partial [Gaiellaceae bacterium]
MSPRLEPLTRGTLASAPSICHGCVWWQGRGDKSVDKKRWIDLAEESWGAWGMVYFDDDERLLGVIQYGPAFLFPRSQKL